MKIKNFKIAVTGPMWVLDQVRVESIDVTSKWQDDTTNGGGSVSLADVDLGANGTLDVFVAFNGQNHTDFKLAITGTTDEATPQKVDYNQPLTIVKNGWLAVTLNKTLKELVKAAGA